MEHDSTVTPVETIARRVRETRNRKGLTAQGLADGLKAQQLQWDRGAVTKLETGRRQNVSAVELLALARVLDVSPVHLLVPLDDRLYQVTPAESVPSDRARAWVRGATPLPGTDVRIFRSEAPQEEWGDTDLPEEAQAENEVTRHLLAGVTAARSAGLTEEQVIQWIRGAWQLSDSLERGSHGEGV